LKPLTPTAVEGLPSFEGRRVFFVFYFLKTLTPTAVEGLPSFEGSRLIFFVIYVF